MRRGLGPVVDPEHAGDRVGQFGRNGERAAASAVAGSAVAGVVATLQLRLERGRDVMHGAAERDGPASAVDVRHREPVPLSKLLHRFHVPRVCAVPLGPLFPADL